MNGVEEGTRYVTLELHDAQLERIEALIERNLARQEAIAANMGQILANSRAKWVSLEEKSKLSMHELMVSRRRLMRVLTASKRRLMPASTASRML